MLAISGAARRNLKNASKIHEIFWWQESFASQWAKKASNLMPSVRCFVYRCTVIRRQKLANSSCCLKHRGACTTFPLLSAALSLFLLITAASDFKIFLFFCIVSVLAPDTEPSLLPHIGLTVFLLSILIQQTKSFY